MKLSNWDAYYLGGERTDEESGWGVDTSKKISSRKLAIRIWSSEERVGQKIINSDHLFMRGIQSCDNEGSHLLK